MSKACPDCRTVTDDRAPHCDACGCVFTQQSRGQSSTWRQCVALAGLLCLLVWGLAALLGFVSTFSGFFKAT